MKSVWLRGGIALLFLVAVLGGIQLVSNDKFQHGTTPDAGSMQYVGDAPRPLLAYYSSVSSSTSLRVEQCKKSGYSDAFLVTDAKREGKLFFFGSAGESIGSNYDFYHEGRTCNDIGAKSLQSPPTPAIPQTVQTEYDRLTHATPKLISVSLQVCQKGSQAVFSVDWSTGYVGGTTYYDLSGKEIGSSSGDDAGGSSHRGFNAYGFTCDLVKEGYPQQAPVSNDASVEPTHTNDTEAESETSTKPFPWNPSAKLDTAQWHTYTNRDYGFSISYPDSYAFDDKLGKVGPDFIVWIGSKSEADPPRFRISTSTLQVSDPEKLKEAFLQSHECAELYQGCDSAFYTMKEIGGFKGLLVKAPGAFADWEMFYFITPEGVLRFAGTDAFTYGASEWIGDDILSTLKNLE